MSNLPGGSLLPVCLAFAAAAACGAVETNPIDAAGDNPDGPPSIDAPPSIDGQLPDASPDGMVSIDAGIDMSIDAPPVTHSLDIRVDGSGTGSVVSNPSGINCPGTCSAIYNSGVNVTLTPSATSGAFAGWSGACSGMGACTVSMTASRSAIATFNLVWPDSISRTCTDGAAFVTCPAGTAGQDGHYQINVPTYPAAANTVFDDLTGLTWQRNPPYTPVSYTAADSYCANLVLDGQSDWRVPNMLELVSLVDAGRVGPPWPTTAFPGIPGNSFFWSRDAYTGGSGSHFGINTNYPVAYIRNDAGSNDLVRCVRGTGFTGSLTISGGSVIDSRTGLTWQSGTGAAQTWQNALAYCEALSLDGFTNWRLPNVKELYSIVDITRTNPAISTSFSSRPATAFWSSTPLANIATSGYAVDFNTGASSGIDTPFGTAVAVRCVR